jgi:hypothetical protein
VITEDVKRAVYRNKHLTRAISSSFVNERGDEPVTKATETNESPYEFRILIVIEHKLLSDTLPTHNRSIARPGQRGVHRTSSRFGQRRPLASSGSPPRGDIRRGSAAKLKGKPGGDEFAGKTSPASGEWVP